MYCKLKKKIRTRGARQLLRLFLSFYVHQVADSETSTQNSKVPVTKSLEEFVIDRLPNQTPVHDLQVQCLFHAIISYALILLIKSLTSTLSEDSKGFLNSSGTTCTNQGSDYNETHPRVSSFGSNYWEVWEIKDSKKNWDSTISINIDQNSISFYVYLFFCL